LQLLQVLDVSAHLTPPTQSRFQKHPVGVRFICCPYLWRAVDAEGEVLDVLVPSRRNKRAALKLMHKLLKKYGSGPEKLITDDLRSYSAPARELGMSHRHERGRWRNNRAENSHQPTRPLVACSVL